MQQGRAKFERSPRFLAWSLTEVACVVDVLVSGERSGSAGREYLRATDSVSNDNPCGEAGSGSPHTREKEY